MRERLSPAAHGFSLVELLIAFVIVGIIAGMARPMLSSAATARIERAVAEVVSALDFARTEALRTGVDHGVSFGTANQRLRVYRVDNSTGMPVERFDVRHPSSRQLYDVALDEATGARIASASFLFADLSTGSAVSFDSRGTPGDRVTTASFVHLTSGWVDVTLGQDTRRVTVTAETGEVVRP